MTGYELAALHPEPPEAVVAGHVCLDVAPALPGPADLAPGSLVEVGPAALSPGGAVANTGVALQRLGVATRLMGRVGDDLFGSAVLDLLRAEGEWLADHLRVAPGAVTSYSVVISPPGADRSFLHCAGANDAFGAEDLRPGAIAGARVFHFGYPPIMRRMYADGGRELRRVLDCARAEGAVTSLDLSLPDPGSAAGRADWAAILASALPAVDLFAPTLEELAFMVDRELHARMQRGGDPWAAVGRPQLRALAERMLALGPAVVAIKLGDRGLYLRTAADPDRTAVLAERLGLDAGAWLDRELRSPCFAADRVVATTGSGDCTIAGLLAALLRGEDPAAAATAATAVGAASVEHAGATAGIVPWPRLAERIRAGWPRLERPLEPGPGARADAGPLGTLEYRAT